MSLPEGLCPPGFRLDGGGETIVFLTPAAGAPRLAYWGPFLEADDDLFARLAVLADRGVPGGGLDDGEALTWLPEAGQGFTGHPAILAHRDGAELITQLALHHVDAFGASANLYLRDELAAVEVELSLRLDEACGVLTSATSLTNRGGPLTIDWFAAGAVDCPHAELMVFDGRWAREFIPVRQTLTTGLFAKDNRTGRTSHHAPPFLFAGEPGFGEAHGEVFAAHLGWSGNARIFAERLRDGRVQLQAGELLAPGEIILQTDQTFQSAFLHIARSATGLNGVSDRLHRFVRSRIIDGRLQGKPRPVHYNTWEAVYFRHDLDELKALADVAAEVGAERFVLDDGWFLGRPDDRSGLGDWTVDPAKYPDGLTPLIDHVRGLGMEFGLWVEPEMANADSDLIRAHPDWVLGDPARRQPLGRGQYVLDLTRPEVAGNIFAQIDTLLRENAIGYLKWDMNRDLTHAVSGGRAATRRQTKAVYGLIDRLRAAHPGVEIESCSSGGGRADYAILARTDRVWTSDCNDPLERQAIQRGFSIVFPPEIMGSHVGPRASHTTARSAGMALRALTALFGAMGMEADLRELTGAEKVTLKAVIGLYKEHRGWMHAGRTIRLEHPDPGLVATALAGEGRMMVSAAQVETPKTAALAPLRLLGLTPAARYKVQRLLAPGRSSLRRAGPSVTGEVLRATGAMLAHTGLALPGLRAGEIAVFLVQEEQG
jgi:alpha-galactosidase